MPFRVCLSTANTLAYPQGGHLWLFLNWAGGLQACGCEVQWLDLLPADVTAEHAERMVAHLRASLRGFGLDGALVVEHLGDTSGHPVARGGAPGLADVPRADLLLDFRYDLPARLVRAFRRSAFVDIDPGILQTALAQGHFPTPPHDVCFTIGERVGTAGAPFPDGGRRWLHTPPCVDLDGWPVTPAAADAPFTTVSHWWMNEWMVDDRGELYRNDKRAGFVPFLDLPGRVSRRIELALHLAGDVQERAMLEARGFAVREAHEAAGTPEAFRRYVQASGGEWSCAKPAYVKLRTGWVSDRTLCYLASGKPCILQDTGPSRLLPEAGGVHRFTDLEGAVRAFRTVIRHYDREAKAARDLAETRFAAARVCRSLLERVL